MRLAIVLVCVPALAIAAPPPLVPVKPPNEPIAFSAPVGWDIHIEPVREKSMSVVAVMARAPAAPVFTCGDTETEIQISIAIDQINATPRALLEDQFPDEKPKAVHGWLCVVTSDDLLCAGKLAGLDRVVSVDTRGLQQAPFKRMNPSDLVFRVIASLSWHGSVDDLHDWRRDGTMAACK